METTTGIWKYCLGIKPFDLALRVYGLGLSENVEICGGLEKKIENNICFGT